MIKIIKKAVKKSILYKNSINNSTRRKDVLKMPKIRSKEVIV